MLTSSSFRAGLKRRSELIANIMIFISALLLGLSLFKPDLFRLRTVIATPAIIKIGDEFKFPIATTAGERTLVLVLQQGCRYCAASAPFYRKLLQAGANSPKVHFVAVLPQHVPVSKRYIASLGLTINDVRQAKLQNVKTPYTPTLLMLDDHRIVRNVWIGQLSTAKEEQVLQTAGLAWSPALSRSAHRD